MQAVHTEIWAIWADTIQAAAAAMSAQALCVQIAAVNVWAEI